MNTKLLGIVYMIGMLAAAVGGFGGNPSSFWTELSFVLFGIGGICGIVALLHLNAFGSKTWARALSVVPLIGFATFVIGSVLTIIGVLQSGDPVYNFLAGVAWIMMLAGMLIVAILTIVAGQWTGWRRFAPLAAVLMIPLGAGIGSLLANTDAMSWLTFLGFLAPGLAIVTYPAAATDDAAAIA